MAERMNIPIAADLLSKSAVPENHPLYIGVYGGAMSSDEHVRNYVESADLVLMLGTFITDMSMGFYTAKLDRGRTVLATSERVNVRYHRYDSIQFRDFLESLSAAKITHKHFKHPNPHALPEPLKKTERSQKLTMVDVFRVLSLHLDERCCVVADIGDDIFGAVGIRSARQAQFIAPAYYMSMGFAVPASIGVAMATKKLRPYVLVGDGAFQMTGVEISTAVRIGQAAHRSRPRSYLRAQTGDCEVPRSARDDRWETTTAPDRPGTGTKDKSCRARNILRRLPQSA